MKNNFSIKPIETRPTNLNEFKKILKLSFHDTHHFVCYELLPCILIVLIIFIPIYNTLMSRLLITLFSILFVLCFFYGLVSTWANALICERWGLEEFNEYGQSKIEEKQQEKIRVKKFFLELIPEAVKLITAPLKIFQKK